MKNVQLNLNVLNKSRIILQPGDVFVLQPTNFPYYFGRVIRTDAKIGVFQNVILIYIFNEFSNKKEYLPILNPKNLLLPPILINRLPWSKGYLETLYNKELTKKDVLQTHCFETIKGNYVDEYGNLLNKPINPIGFLGLWSYRVLDDEISKKLGIPLAPD